MHKRLLKKGTRIRQSPADYLAYALLDTIVDNYVSLLADIREHVEELEDRVTENPTPESLTHVYTLKRELVFLRRTIWPLREMVNSLQRLELPLISASTRPYLRDLYDQTNQVADTIESFRDMVASSLDIYLSSVSNRMNEVMKVLTIIATIFIPLTFISGVYGMNFRFMPELEWEYGYPAVLLLMASIVALMLAYFKYRKWL